IDAAARSPGPGAVQSGAADPGDAAPAPRPAARHVRSRSPDRQGRARAVVVSSALAELPGDSRRRGPDARGMRDHLRALLRRLAVRVDVRRAVLLALVRQAGRAAQVRAAPALPPASAAPLPRGALGPEGAGPSPSPGRAALG